MPKHRQDSVQPQKPVGFHYVEDPQMTWTNSEELYRHWKTWKQRCELTWVVQVAHITETQKVNQCFGETGLEIFNTCDVDKETVTHIELFNRREVYWKPQANDLKARFDMYQVQ